MQKTTVKEIALPVARKYLQRRKKYGILTKSKEQGGMEDEVAIATLTSKGQVTIPSSVRAAIGLVAGDQIEFVPDGENRYVIVPKFSSVRELKGIVQKPEIPVSLEDMEEAIIKGAVRDWY